MASARVQCRRRYGGSFRPPPGRARVCDPAPLLFLPGQFIEPARLGRIGIEGVIRESAHHSGGVRVDVDHEALPGHIADHLGFSAEKLLRVHWTCQVTYAHAGNPSLLRSGEHTSELQTLMRISYAVFCLKKKKNNTEI